MFSKAPVKRFNDEVGCGPAPTQYEPRGQSSAAGAFSMPKSNRFVEPKFVPPAPNQYQDPRLPPTPSKRAGGSSALRRTGSVRRHQSVQSNVQTSQLSQPSFNSSQRSDGGSSSPVQQLEAEVAELRTRNAALLDTISQLTASMVTYPVGSDGVILSAIGGGAAPSPVGTGAESGERPAADAQTAAETALDTEKAAADCVSDLVAEVERQERESCRCREVESRLTALDEQERAARGQLLAGDDLERLDGWAGRLERCQKTAEEEARRRLQLEQQVMVLKRTAESQTLRMKELELLLQVARESEVDAHEDACRLSDRLSVLESDLADSQRQRHALEETRDDLLNQLTDTVERLNEGRAQREHSQREALLLRRRCDALDADLQRTSHQITSREREAAALRDKLDAERQRSREAEEREGEGRQRAEQTEAQLAEARAQLEAAQAERSEAELQLAALDGSLAALGQERDELAAARAELHRQLAERDAEQQRSQAVAEELRAQRTDLETRLAKLGAEAERSALAAAALVDERAAVQRELAETRGQLGRVADQLSGETERAETLRSELWYAGLQRRLTAEDAAELSETVAQKERAIRRLDAARRDKEARLEKMARRTDEMAAAIQDASRELEHVRSEVQAERMRAEELALLDGGRKEMLALLEREKVALTLSVAERQAELDDARCELDAARAELARTVRIADERAARLQEELETAETRRHTAEAQLEETRAELHESSESVARRTAEVEALSGTVAEHEEQLRNKNDQLSGLKTEICEKEDVIAVLEARVQNLETDGSRNRAELEQLRESDRALTETVDGLRSEAAVRAEELAVATAALAEKEVGLRELCSARDEQEAALTELRGELEQQRAALADREDALASATAETGRLQQRCEELEEAGAAALLELTQLRGESAALQTALNDREDQLVEARHQVTDLRDQNTDLARVCDESREQLETRAAELRRTADELVKRETELTQRQQEVDRLKKLNAEAVQSHKQAEALVQSVRENMEEMKSLYEEIIDEKDSNAAELKEQLDAEVAARKEEAAEALAAREEIAARLEKAEAARRETAEECTILRNEIKLTSSSIEYLEAEREKAIVANAEVTRGLQDQLATAEAAAAEQKSRATEALKRAATQQEEARVARLLVSEEQRHAASVLAERDEWRARAETAEAGRKTADAELAAVREERDKVEEARRAADTARTELESRLAQMEASHESDLSQLYDNFADMRQKLQQAYRQDAALREAAQEVPRLQEALRKAEGEVRAQAEARAEAENRLQEQQDQSEWKDKYEKLFALVEPFQTQLELYRAERRCLLEQSEGTRAELERLAGQYSQLLGHQNKKQKIHHIMQLKEENLQLKKSLATAEKKVQRQRVLVKQLEDRLHGDQNSTLLNATVSSKSKTRAASYDVLSRTVADPQHMKEGLSLLAVTPLKENSTNRAMGSPVAASSSLKSARGSLKFT
ncbi:plectin-like [Amphibalanus amphitrite]|uniref:plectin-like n=1 Tax=Amphibalanus amphitrite TaxID=1232801 RepID=UPI001C920A4D|nr:plectin-like [Amphibalanus amphitrite]XP_043213242.1 plectin-like [Amphibalanus amphitrite]XP_043213244.1 plectin-like [Amphibalanus amphitrite]